nr:immunoglobulin heavy chain junction region [Mus musculus]
CARTPDGYYFGYW